MNTKKLKKIAICLVVLLMVVAGTLAWLTTSEYKKGKIGAGNFTLDVEGVRPVEANEIADAGDGFINNEDEQNYSAEGDEIKDDDDNVIGYEYHFYDEGLMPVSQSNYSALLNEKIVPTKYIRITNNNDTDAFIEISAKNVKGFESKSDKVTWLLGSPYQTYNETTNDDEKTFDELSLANILKVEQGGNNENNLVLQEMVDTFRNVNSPINSVTDSNGDMLHNDFFYLTSIGYTKEQREDALYTDTYTNDNEEEVEYLDSYIEYEEPLNDDGSNVGELTQRNIITVPTDLDEYTPSELILNPIKTSLPKIEAPMINSLKNILKVKGSEDNDATNAIRAVLHLQDRRSVAVENVATEIEGQYVRKTFEDATNTEYALPLILRAHTSIVIPFKVFLNENWEEQNGEFEYIIQVKGRNYTDGDGIEFTKNKIKTDRTKLTVDSLADSYDLALPTTNAPLAAGVLNLMYDDQVAAAGDTNDTRLSNLLTTSELNTLTDGVVKAAVNRVKNNNTSGASITALEVNNQILDYGREYENRKTINSDLTETASNVEKLLQKKSISERLSEVNDSETDNSDSVSDELLAYTIEVLETSSSGYSASSDDYAFANAAAETILKTKGTNNAAVSFVKNVLLEVKGTPDFKMNIAANDTVNNPYFVEFFNLIKNVKIINSESSSAVSKTPVATNLSLDTLLEDLYIAAYKTKDLYYITWNSQTIDKYTKDSFIATGKANGGFRDCITGNANATDEEYKTGLLNSTMYRLRNLVETAKYDYENSNPATYNTKNTFVKGLLNTIANKNLDSSFDYSTYNYVENLTASQLSDLFDAIIEYIPKNADGSFTSRAKEVYSW